MQSKAATVEEYLASLPEDRRRALSAVREVFRKNLDKGYVEGMGYGMMGYSVPHSLYPPGYHCDPKTPLPFAGMASQKNHMSVYLMCIYADTPEEKWFRSAWARTGKKLDMGKCCIRFKRLEDLALDVIGEAIRRVPVRKYIEMYERTLLRTNKRAAAKARARSAAPAKPRSAKAAPARRASARSRTKTVSRRVAGRGT